MSYIGVISIRNRNFNKDLQDGTLKPSNQTFSTCSIDCSKDAFIHPNADCNVSSQSVIRLDVPIVRAAVKCLMDCEPLAVLAWKLYASHPRAVLRTIGHWWHLVRKGKP